jgi:hypothetical protein
MAIQQPQSTDRTNSPDHALSHRIFANDENAPVLSVVVGSDGKVSVELNTVVEDLSSQCNGSNQIFTTVETIKSVIWLVLGGGQILIDSVHFAKTGVKEITTYFDTPLIGGSILYVKFVKA